MALIDTTLISVTNSVAQPLFITDFPQTRVPRIVSTGSSVTVAFDTTATQTTGTSATFNLTTDVATLQPNVTFMLTAYAQFAGSTPTKYKLVNAATDATLAGPNPIGETLSLAVRPASTTTVKLVAYTVNGTNWMPPSQITNANLIIQAVSGFTT
jgi:hypothetical protein